MGTNIKDGNGPTDEAGYREEVLAAAEMAINGLACMKKI